MHRHAIRARGSHTVGAAVLLLLASCSVEPTWVRTFDGSRSGFDYASSVALDGSDVVVLGTTPNGLPGARHDYLLLRFDQDGQKLWERTLPSSFDAVPVAFVMESTERAYVLGPTELIAIHPRTGEEIWRGPGGLGLSVAGGRIAVTGERTVVLDENGAVLWQTSYDATFPWPYGDGEPTKVYQGRKVALGPDGCVHVAGTRYIPRPNGEWHKDFWLARYHPSGTLAWELHDGGDADDDVAALAVSADGRILLSAYHTGTSLEDGGAETRAYASDGSLSWNHRFRSSGYTTTPNDMTLGPNGEALVVTRSPRSVGGAVRSVVVYGADGTLRWTAETAGLREGPHRIRADSEGHVYVTGEDHTVAYGVDGAELFTATDPSDQYPNDVAIDVARQTMYLATTVLGTRATDIHLAKYAASRRRP